MSVHHAPPVAYPVRRALLPTVLALGIWVSGLALFVVWRAGFQEPDWRTLILACLLVATGAGVILGTRQQATGRLHWDGAVWGWESDRMPTQLEAASLMVVADLQLLIIVRMTLQRSRPVWLGVNRIDFPERWLDFRRAIHLPGKAVPLPESTSNAVTRALRPVAAFEPVVDLTSTRFNQ